MPLAPVQSVSVVTRPATAGGQMYLQVTPQGAAWTPDPHLASAFDSMREATRAAFRLPSDVKAFSMPLAVERDAFATRH